MRAKFCEKEIYDSSKGHGLPTKDTVSPSYQSSVIDIDSSHQLARVRGEFERWKGERTAQIEVSFSVLGYFGIPTDVCPMKQYPSTVLVDEISPLRGV